jgi:hypothetical protein
VPDHTFQTSSQTRFGNENDHRLASYEARKFGIYTLSMKFNLNFVQLSILLFANLWMPRCFADTARVAPTQSAIEATPNSLTLTGTRCFWGDCTQDHVLSIRTSEALAQLEVVPLPLTRENGQNIPSPLLPVAPVIPQVSANRVLSIPLKFNPARLSSGEYKGELLLTYQGGVQRIPVLIQVKDSWLPPLLVLLAGVILGVVVSAYREQGQPRDRVIVRIGQLRTQLLGDPELGKAIAFQEWIEDHLIDVEAALQRRQFVAGEAAIGEAEALWIKWRKGRADWLQLMAYQDQLTGQVTQLGSSRHFGQTAMRQLGDRIKNMPMNSPEQLRDQLEAIAKQIYQYAQIMPKMTKLSHLVQSLPEDQLPVNFSALQKRFSQLSLVNVTDVETLSTRLEEALKQMVALEQEIDGAIAILPEAPVQRGMEKVGRGSEIFAMPFAIAPAARPISLERQIQKANGRLRLFVGTSYAIAVIFLAGAGFVELYADKPKFGAAPWRDYFALLAWGFGAEAARDAVTKTVRNWQLPGVKQGE